MAVSSPPARIVGGSQRVVDTPGFSIDELIGNVATSQDNISVAKVAAKKGTAEPWLTLHYEEYMCILKGSVLLTFTAHSPLLVKAGQTVQISTGTRFRPSFDEDTEYIPICLPAFSPTRCVREDENVEGEAIATGLEQLHAKGRDAGPTCAPESVGSAGKIIGEAKPEVLYHMCPVRDWEAAERSGSAYYPPTFEQDDFLTHATGVPSRLVDTANHYYQDSPGDWVCLEFTRTALRDSGIYVRDEHATAVGDKPTDDALMDKWVCPHIIGGIPLGVVGKKYVMTRDGTKFTGIEGLV